MIKNKLKDCTALFTKGKSVLIVKSKGHTVWSGSAPATNKISGVTVEGTEIVELNINDQQVVIPVVDNEFEYVIPQGTVVTSLGQMMQQNDTIITIDISQLNTSEVTDMNSLVEGAVVLQGIALEGIDTSKVTNMYAMFENFQPSGTLDLSGFDTNKVTDMSSMFSGAIINSLDISNFDFTNITNNANMFAYSTIGSINLVNAVVPAGIDYISMFSGVYGGTIYYKEANWPEGMKDELDQGITWVNVE